MQFPDFEYVITKEKYQQFIAVSDDTHQLHVNLEYAKSKGFDDVVVHGNILNCILSNVIGMKLDFENVMIVNQTINYRKPIYINDTLTLKLKLKEEMAFLPGMEMFFKFFRKEELIANGTILIKTDL